MSAIPEEVDEVLCQMDDILVFGATQDQHDERIREVLKRVQLAKVTLNTKKCEFSVREVRFLRQPITESGVNSDAERVRAIGSVRLFLIQ